MLDDMIVCLRNPATILPSSALSLTGTEVLCCRGASSVRPANRTKYAHRQLFDPQEAAHSGMFHDMFHGMFVSFDTYDTFAIH